MEVEERQVLEYGGTVVGWWLRGREGPARGEVEFGFVFGCYGGGSGLWHVSTW